METKLPHTGTQLILTQVDIITLVCHNQVTDNYNMNHCKASATLDVHYCCNDHSNACHSVAGYNEIWEELIVMQ